jgi:prolipoprotein diacylglyceryltransferase
MVPWHLIFESLAYFIAFRVYLWDRRRSGDFLDTPTRWTVVAAAIGGAAAGSKILFWLEDPARTAQQWNDLAYLMSGKTVVGALLGGTIAVEWIKRRTGVQRRTGDLFAVPLAIGIAIGRIGCFLAGLHDDTHGVATSLPWGVDLGDGIPRHPVQLYESAAMLLTAFALGRTKGPIFQEGDRFRLFLLVYFGWRLLVDMLKPGVRFGGFTTIQYCCMLALIWYAPDLRRILARIPKWRSAPLHG